MLALVIEKITGMTYQDAMEKIVFKPLGMTNTMYLIMKKDKKLQRLLIEQIFLVNWII
jgi:CubicO group peptidase (beta-lactamase class C family)